MKHKPGPKKKEAGEKAAYFRISVPPKMGRFLREKGSSREVQKIVGKSAEYEEWKRERENSI